MSIKNTHTHIHTQDTSHGTKKNTKATITPHHLYDILLMIAFIRGIVQCGALRTKTNPIKNYERKTKQF